MPQPFRTPSALVLALALGVGACADSPTAPASAADQAALGTAAPRRSTAKFEIDYMTFSIDHHTAGIEMAELCIDRAEHAVLIALCEQSLVSQREEIATLQEWLRDWYGISYEGTVPQSAREDLRRLAQLDGEEFEDDFLTEFSKHHLRIIKESDKAVRRAYHSELRDMARMIIAAQSQGVIMMQNWDCQWYDDCRQGLKRQAQKYA